MAAPLHQIRDWARSIQREVPQLTTGYRAGMGTRARLEQLGQMCGLGDATVLNAPDNDLIGLYQVACKDPQSALKVAARIASRVDPFGKPVEQPEPMRVPLPDSMRPAPGTMDERTVRAVIADAIEEGVLAPVQSAIDAMDKSLRDDMRATARATLDAATETALAAMRDGMRDAATEALRSLTPTRLDVAIGDAPPVPLGLVHRDTAKIINALAAGVNVYLHGPAGSGKTTVARKCAEAFKVSFYFAAKVESEYQLLGFKDARGETVRTQFREAYEHGGIFLFDEMDASSPAAVVALNAALANGVCPFPDGIVTRHAQFYCLGAGNTALTGATRAYAGRNQLDAASIDRFAFIEFGYDDDLEAALATDAAWCGYVQAVRGAIKERGLNHLVTPRATYDGCKLLAAGLHRDMVADMVVFKGLDRDTVKQIQEAVSKMPEDPSRPEAKMAPIPTERPRFMPRARRTAGEVI